MRSVLILLALFLSLQVYSKDSQLNSESVKLESDVAVKYQEALNSYRETLNAYRERSQIKSGRSLLSYAKNLYLIGQKYHNEEGVKYASLAQNYAFLMNSPHPDKKSIPLLKEAIEIYENEEQPPTKNLVQVILELGKVYKSNRHKKRKARSKFEQAIELAEDSGDQLLLAETELTVGIAHLNAAAMTEREVKWAIKNLEAAHKLYSQLENERVVTVDFWLGKANSYLQRTDKSIKYFERVIEQNDKAHNIHQLAMSSHAFLVEAYSKIDEPEKATEHCQAIGAVTPWSGDGEIKPIYFKRPSYPKDAARQGSEGWVKTVFTVDPQGFAKEIIVTDEHGHSSFSKATLEAIKDWRFAPKFEDGKPVAAKAIYTLHFKLASRR